MAAREKGSGDAILGGVDASGVRVKPWDPYPVGRIEFSDISKRLIPLSANRLRLAN